MRLPSPQKDSFPNSQIKKLIESQDGSVSEEILCIAILIKKVYIFFVDSLSLASYGFRHQRILDLIVVL